MGAIKKPVSDHAHHALMRPTEPSATPFCAVRFIHLRSHIFVGVKIIIAQCVALRTPIGPILLMLVPIYLGAQPCYRIRPDV